MSTTLISGLARTTVPQTALRRFLVLPVRLVIEANYLWTALSLVSLLVWFSPTTAGALWIPAQALVVAAFALAQQTALRATAAGR
ncbi:hypothetical protein [Streptomyces sp. NPDC059708]|uniref:hypothetical protein n=1 Tax=Streptomyces sp. NPDC059708 TaxID=3346916 RepID=UPI0036D1A36A